MKPTLPLTFKIALEDWEFEQIYRLNYRTFVEEICQHQSNVDRALVDRFHGENTYIICLQGADVLGMVAVRGRRPFSLDEKLGNLDSYLPRGRSVCEIRLLSVEKNHRSSLIFRGLGRLLFEHCRSQGYDMAVISGVLRQQSLYERLGFVPFGPVVGTEKAQLQPMSLTLEAFEGHTKAWFQSNAGPFAGKPAVNLLPGPVAVSREVRRAFVSPPISHRSDSFRRAFEQTRQVLCELVGARHVAILMGSGTLANDTIAGQLSLNAGRGLILSNGEFGNRLIDHATGFGLSFDVLQVDWGEAFDRADIERIIDRDWTIKWLWAVHCETSTGVFNDMAMLRALCDERKIHLCMDCVSSLGTVAVDLRGVYLSSAVSGKGLGAYPGLSMVFYDHEIHPAPGTLPRYMDLGLYALHGGIPFTHSSNLIRALQTALKRFDSNHAFDEVVHLSSWLRFRLHELGFQILASDAKAFAAVITLVLPKTISSAEVGRQLAQAGYLLSYQSEYLLNRNWIQICLMGKSSQEQLAPLLDLLWQLCHSKRLAS